MEANPTPELRAHEDDTQEGMFLTFVLGDQSYGLAIRNVTEIIGLQAITAVPDVPDYIRGIINLRGKVIPVMDVRIRFNMPARDYDARTCIIVVQIGGSSVGLVVDTVSEVVSIPPSDVEPPPRVGTRGSNEVIEGVGKVGDDVKLLLDVDKLLFSDQVMAVA